MERKEHQDGWSFLSRPNISFRYVENMKENSIVEKKKKK